MMKGQLKQQGKFYIPEHRNEGVRLRDFVENYVWSSQDKDEMTQERKQEIEQSGLQAKYPFLIKKAVDSKKQSGKRVNILMEDLEAEFSTPADAKLLYGLKTNTLIYQEQLEQIVQDIIQFSGWKQLGPEEMDNEDDYLMKQEYLMQLREQRMLQNSSNDPQNNIHPLLKRIVEVYIVRGPQTKSNIISMRQLKADVIGSLVTVSCIIVRSSEVKPEIKVASYACETCGHEIFQSVHGIVFTPLNECQSKKCQTNKTRGKLQLVTQNCKFFPYQELIVQETSDQIPAGSIPRAYTVICRGNNVRPGTPGDIVKIQGIVCPMLDNSYRGSQRSLMDIYIEAFHVVKEKQKYRDMTIPEEIQAQIVEERDTKTDEELYDNLAASIAPEIHGLEDVKKALLLMMVGGCQLDRKDGMHIRGDINVALIGDPGIAKSQLLKQISKNAPRSVYTTGKGSSGVGLTASVLKDGKSGEVSLEAGALVLADKGVCCIDEFDKMNEYDRTAIHEVMEQQTVSIAKAGITTTLNARTSILAAANPLYSRYNKQISPEKNINMPAALLSRFDLVFILVDSSDENKDMLLAAHIGKLHQMKRDAIKTKAPYSTEFIKSYIGLIKNQDINPTLAPEVHQLIQKEYVQRRKNQEESKYGQYTTPRTLLSLIRLACAHAKIRQSKKVEEQDVLEAIRLVDMAQQSVREDDDDLYKERKPKQSPKDKIYNEIKRKCGYKLDRTILKSDILKSVLNMGYTEVQLQECLGHYESINVLSVSEHTITYVE